MMKDVKELWGWKTQAPSGSYNVLQLLHVCSFLIYFFSASCTVAHGVGGKCMPKTV